MDEGITALMIASVRGGRDTAEILIKYGADVNATKKNGRTALMMAADEGHAWVVDLLIANGANVNAKSVTGDTAMKLAKDERTRKAIIRAVEERKSNTFLGKVKRSLGLNK